MIELSRIFYGSIVYNFYIIEYIIIIMISKKLTKVLEFLRYLIINRGDHHVAKVPPNQPRVESFSSIEEFFHQ